MAEYQAATDDRLLRALAEQLKHPLLHIARSSELADNPEAFPIIMRTANMALQLVDSYLLSNDLHAQQVLQLEPVSIASVMQSAAHELAYHAKQYDCDIQLSLSGKYAPVMGNRQALQSAFVSLGYALIEAQRSDQPRRVVLGVRSNQQGLIAGVFSDQKELSADMFRRAKALYGTARQPLVSVSASAAAGVFIADSLFSAIASPLRVAQHRNLTGLATLLLPSQQLQLV